MNSRLSILLLWIAFFAVSPAKTLRACNEGDIQNTSVYQVDDAHCDAEEDACLETHPGQDCPPDTDGCGHCHCPGCGSSGIASTGFVRFEQVSLTHIPWLYKKRAGNFNYQAPDTSAHLAALFRPPIFSLT